MVSIASENVTVMLSVIDTELWLSAVVEIEETVGAVVSTTNELIFNVTLRLLTLSVTVIVQFE